MQKILIILKEHYLIILFSIGVSLISIFPQIVFERKLGAEYKGVYRQINDDELYYLARGQEIQDGHPGLGNPYIYEHKDKPTVQFFLPDYIVNKSLGWTGLSVRQIFFVYDIVFPFLLTILTYVCFLVLTRSRFWSILGVLYLVFGIFFYYFNRAISPQFVFIFYLTLFIFLVNYIRSEGKKKIYLYLSLFNFGLLFYLYTYFWTFYFVVISITCAILFLRKERKLALDMFSILGGGVLLGSYYFYASFSSSKLPEYWDTLTRLGMIYSHFPSGIIIVFLGGLVCLSYVIVFRKNIFSSRENIFILSGVLAGMIVVNQHIITGKNLAFTLHYYQPVMYWFGFAIVFILSQMSLSRVKLVGILIVSYMVIAGVTSGGNQLLMTPIQYFQMFSTIDPKELYQENYADIFTWLNNNTQVDAVVLANEDLSEYIPAYTHNNVFFARFANLHFMTDEEIFKRFYINNVFYTVDEAYLKENIKSLYGVRFIDEYGHAMQVNKIRKIFNLKPLSAEYYPKESIDKIEATIAPLRKKKIQDLFKEYRVDYVVWDKIKDPAWGINKLSFLTKVYSANNIEVYELSN